ncbi:unnamed protein product [Vitrella brassicaformis CCMP3155]|uniref:2Fe-2S ferredoxin-type domain-containing protein n=1 Tax=Vitrella brassicaformis (strain CCMP3155) TaxID=1169540 RepID=A0A0G4EX22_VITBC|nr:unnamed protein product [Vitrella brassicaformis CCMP3155]|eukprot:CEM03211.1 unnamed protein product [Vitrella brassicaformis CCMP3155]
MQGVSRILCFLLLLLPASLAASLPRASPRRGSSPLFLTRTHRPVDGSSVRRHCSPFLPLQTSYLLAPNRTPIQLQSLLRPPKSTTVAAAASSPLALQEEFTRPQTGDEASSAEDGYLFNVSLPRITGIEWASTLAFDFAYVNSLEYGSAASSSRMIQPGDWLVGVNQGSAIREGIAFDDVMRLFDEPNVAKTDTEVQLRFFRGSPEAFQQYVREQSGRGDSDPPPPQFMTITVVKEGQQVATLGDIPTGSNLRDVLTDNGINVYQSYTRYTNCSGKQLCGTCIVRVREGMENTSMKELDELATLKGNPESYRLSCVTDVYGDVTVEVFPPVPRGQFIRGPARTR